MRLRGPGHIRKNVRPVTRSNALAANPPLRGIRPETIFLVRGAPLTSPLVSYKYRTGPSALRCLSEGTAYFASPSELNDSLEAKFDIADAAQFARVIGKTLTELSLRRGEPSFSYDEDSHDAYEAVDTRETERFVAGCQRVGIFSCAPRPDNQPMWAYYCGNEQGVCFHLEWPKAIVDRYHLFPTQVTYSRETRLINRADHYRQTLLELAVQNPKWSLAQIKAFSLTEQFRLNVGINGVAQAVSIKHADWQHEQEIRMLALRSGPLPLMQDILKSVIYTRTDFPEWGPIVMLLHQLYPKVQQVRLC